MNLDECKCPECGNPAYLTAGVYRSEDMSDLMTVRPGANPIRHQHRCINNHKWSHDVKGGDE